MNKRHNYNLTIKWTGNKGVGTKGYQSYDRSHSVSAENKTEILCSSDPSFSGDKTKYNPEELFVASISSCHMPWYLHLCSDAGVIVIDYSDNATGSMQETEDGGGFFTEVILHPHVVVQDPSMIEKAIELHHRANELCFIAKSCNFPILHKATCKVVSGF
jgi:organic hydroperoxide reductase OsmC/OhrA